MRAAPLKTNFPNGISSSSLSFPPFSFLPPILYEALKPSRSNQRRHTNRAKKVPSTEVTIWRTANSPLPLPLPNRANSHYRPPPSPRTLFRVLKLPSLLFIILSPKTVLLSCVTSSRLVRPRRRPIITLYFVITEMTSDKALAIHPRNGV